MTALPGEIYRDPVYDGATDPVIVAAPDGDLLFYTQRRATHPDPGAGVAWVHGSRIGVARRTGAGWTYLGTLEPDGDDLRLRHGPPPAVVDRTHWAPEIVRAGDGWRMYLTEIDGVPVRWEGHPRRIVEYRSDDLARWRRIGPVDLDGDRVIDAAVALCPDGRWRMWFKDEAADSVTRVAVSDDLETWHPDGVAIGGRPHEGPFVFPLGGWWWMLTDEWRGMAVHRSADAVGWERQGGADAVILGESGPVPGVQVGRHGAVRPAAGEEAVLVYFTHPGWDGSEIADIDAVEPRRSVVHEARLRVVDGVLDCRR